MPDILELNNRFSFRSRSSNLCFKAAAGAMPVLEIQNEQSCARIGLQGAHLLSWIPKGRDEVIWVSEQASFAPGKSVRGGIPVCWPWFGAHERDASFPAHGFARTSLWQVTDVRQLSDGATQICFLLDSALLGDRIQNMWPTPTTAEYRITVSEDLTLELVTKNNSDQEITLGQALHTYFQVQDVSKSTVTGLAGKDYLDKTDGFKRKTQAGPVVIESEVDRVYLNSPEDVCIHDQHRQIVIKKHGSHSTVVWNPWKAAAEKMGDLGREGYLNMLCVESANAAEDTLKLGPSQSHQLTVTYSVSGQ